MFIIYLYLIALIAIRVVAWLGINIIFIIAFLYFLPYLIDRLL